MNEHLVVEPDAGLNVKRLPFLLARNEITDDCPVPAFSGCNATAV